MQFYIIIAGAYKINLDYYYIYVILSYIIHYIYYIYHIIIHLVGNIICIY